MTLRWPADPAQSWYRSIEDYGAVLRVPPLMKVVEVDAGSPLPLEKILTEETHEFRVEFSPSLVEEAVLLAIETQTPERRARFRRERNSVYQVTDPEAREARFREVHGRWFTQLDVGSPILELLEEQPIVMRGARVCLVLLARDRKEEGADLYGECNPKLNQNGIPPALVIRLQANSLLDLKSRYHWLRHELGYVADMLNPDFGYEPNLGGPSTGPQLENLVRARYHLLWDIRVDGRLAAAGYLPEQVEEVRRKEFAAAFPILGSDTDVVFESFFRSQRSTHRELLEFARNPRVDRCLEASSDRCSLCNSLAFSSCVAGLTPEVIDRIQEDFPEWRLESGLCRQCADLYAAKIWTASAGLRQVHRCGGGNQRGHHLPANHQHGKLGVK